jgi:hypothetical protein
MWSLTSSSQLELQLLVRSAVGLPQQQASRCLSRLKLYHVTFAADALLCCPLLPKAANRSQQ